MQIIEKISEEYTGGKTCLALGTFDGVHAGHQSVILSAVGGELVPGVFTFSHPPKAEVGKDGAKLLTPISVKQKLLCEMGMKVYISPNFHKIRNMSASEFIDFLSAKYRVKKLCCGFNFRFGKNREGTPLLLKQLAKERGIAVSVLPPVLDLGDTISSSRIRACIEKGDVESASRMLGHRFSYDFLVIKGDQRGREMGVPTINQKWENEIVTPKFGVYMSSVKRNGRKYAAVTNIGIRPTVGSDFVRSETYIIGLNEDLYGQNVEVELVSYLRPEKRFHDLHELKRQIYKDISDVKNSKII